MLKEKQHKCKELKNHSLKLMLLNMKYKDKDSWGWYLVYYQIFPNNPVVSGANNLVPAKFCYGCGKKLEISKT